MILAEFRDVAIRRSLLPVLSAYFYKNFTHTKDILKNLTTHGFSVIITISFTKPKSIQRMNM